METNRYVNFQPQQYISNYVPLPFNEIMQVAANKQAKQDDAMQKLAKIDNDIRTIKSLPGDRDYAKEQIDKLSGEINEFAKLDFNDPSVRNQWNKKKSEITSRFAPTGDLGVIDNNYNRAIEWNKQLLDKSKESGWGSSQLSSWGNNQLMSHKTINEDGTYNTFNGRGVYNRVDYNKKISDLLKDVESDTGVIGLSKYGSLDAITTAYQHGEINHKDYNKILNSLAMRSQSDPEIVQSLEQEGMFNGQEGFGKFIKGSDKQGNVIVDENNPFGQMLIGAASGAQFKKTDMKYMTVQDEVALHKAKNAIDNPQFTLSNDGVLTAGKTISFEKNLKTIESLEQQLKSLPAEGSAQDNFQTKATRESLKKQLQIAQNYQYSSTNSFANSAKGKQKLIEDYRTMMSGRTGGKLATALNDPKVKQYIKNEQDYISYIKGDLILPPEIEKLTFDSGIMSNDQISPVSKNLKQIISDVYTQDIDREAPEISYSAKVLTGNDKSTVGKLNKELTERVNQNRTNYWIEGGQDLDTYLQENLPEGAKINIAVLDNDINGQFAHYMTIVDKDGKTLIQTPVYPKSGAREEQDYIGRKLQSENMNQADQMEQSNYNRGLRMQANSKYGEALDDDLARSAEFKAKTLSKETKKPASVSSEVRFNLSNGNEFKGNLIVTYDNGITYYELANNQNKPVTSKYKSLDDLKVDLYKTENNQ